MRKHPAPPVPAESRRVPVALTRGDQTVHGVMHWENSPHGTVIDDQGRTFYAATLIHNGWVITEITLAGGTYTDARG